MCRNSQSRPLSTEGKRKLNHLFAALRRNKIAARQNFSCCQNCGCYEMSEFMAEHPQLIGFAFYHHQDGARLYEDSGTYLTFGGSTAWPDSPMGRTEQTVLERTMELEALAVGNIIVREAKNAGLYVSWNGKTATRIYVSEVPTS